MGLPFRFPSFSNPEFEEFVRLGRVIRAILPLSNGSIAHLFVVYGYQGSSDDYQKLALTKRLLEAVICEARVCGSGQPVIVAGDLNVKPSVIPVTAKDLKCGHLIDLEEAYARWLGISASPACKFALDGAPCTRRDFFLVCPNALAACVGCGVLVDKWTRPHFSVEAWFQVGAWSAQVQNARTLFSCPCWLAGLS